MEFMYVFLFSGVGYGFLEILWRGYTHWSMLVTGGICGTVIYFVASYANIPYIMKILLCTAIVTSVEFIVGCIVNLNLGWNVWDYSNQFLNFKGQICIMYSFLWLLISIILVPICSKIHDNFFVNIL